MSDLERDHVHKFYSQYASDFDITRVKTWPKIASFLESSDKPGFINLDCGCGNGRNLIRNTSTNNKSGSIWMGLDYSRELLTKVNSKLQSTNNLPNPHSNVEVNSHSNVEVNSHSNVEVNSHSNVEVNPYSTIKRVEVTRGDCLALPFKDYTFNLILSIAVIHHFSTPSRRAQALREMGRILKPDGKILLYVWDESTKKKSKFKQIQDKDYMVKFNGVFDRYYYLYDLKEIEEVCRENGFTVEESGIEQESIYLILTKK